MRKPLKVFSVLFLLCSCAEMAPPPLFQGGGAAARGGERVDHCRFHVNRYGYGARWASLPVPITIHEGSVPQKAVDTIFEVVEEWNHTWNQNSNQGALFDVLGSIDYPQATDTMGDKENTISFLYSADNRRSQILNPRQQGMTNVSGARYLKEADIFINEDHFDFFYEDNPGFLAKEEDESQPRSLASFDEPSFFKRITRFLFRLLFFWKKEAVRGLAEAPVPRHLVDFHSLIAHELGHVLGMGHNNQRGSIMRTNLSAGVRRRGLRSIELDSILCAYGENNRF